MIEPTAKHLDALTLTHYRTDHDTYIDTDLWSSDIVELGWEAQYVWMRLLSGPEFTRDGFPRAALSKAIDPRELAVEPALESLERAGLITIGDTFITYPNIAWGEPPEDDQ